MSSDAVQILNTLDNQRVTQKDYADVAWQYLNDQNNGNYSNMIQFNTSTLKPYFVDYHNAYIYMPMTVQANMSEANALAYNGAEAIAFRDSILELFQSLIVTTDTGMTIVNENLSMLYINMIRLRIENSMEWFNVMGGQLHMANCIDKWLDTSDAVAAPNTFTGITNYVNETWLTNVADSGTAGIWNDPNKYKKTLQNGETLITNLNPYCNEGFRQRIGIFKNAFSYNASTHSYDGVVMIPLALLHDFFKQLNIAVINIGFNFQFYLTQPELQVQNFQVFMTADGVSNIPVTQPLISYGRANVNSFGAGLRLYYRNVKFNAADSERIKGKLQENFTKSINFISTDFIPDRSSLGTMFSNAVGMINTKQTHAFQQEIATSVVYPLRVWILCYPDVAITGAKGANRWPLTYTPFYIDDLNVNINNNPYKKLPMKWYHDNWEEIKAQFPTEYSTIMSYNDHRRFAQWQCFDLQRLGLERITSPTEPVSLSVTGNITRPAGCSYPSCKIIYLIERMNEVTFRFSTTETSMVVGNISLNNTA